QGCAAQEHIFRGSSRGVRRRQYPVRRAVEAQSGGRGGQVLVLRSGPQRTHGPDPRLRRRAFHVRWGSSGCGLLVAQNAGESGRARSADLCEERGPDAMRLARAGILLGGAAVAVVVALAWSRWPAVVHQERSEGIAQGRTAAPEPAPVQVRTVTSA